MVKSLKKYQNILEMAKKDKYVIPQFNINNLEWTKYILEACEEAKSPVFLGVSVGAAKYMGGYNTVVKMIQGLITDLKITIPVMIHLDHSPSVSECLNAYEAGFDSLMIDASLEELEKNISATNEVTTLCPNALIEAELGRIGGAEDDIAHELRYTNSEQAATFCNQTNIDMLAPSLGSVHGLYKEEPNINFEVMQSIIESTNKPLVLHGGSGLPVEILKRSIEHGVCKINFNTELQVAWNKAVRDFIENNVDVYDPRKIISAGEQALKETVKTYINILGSNNKG